MLPARDVRVDTFIAGAGKYVTRSMAATHLPTGTVVRRSDFPGTFSETRVWLIDDLARKVRELVK